MRPLLGDYVLATKYDDGDPCDHFCVGTLIAIVDEESRDPRYLLIDSEGKLFRRNGFRRAEKITPREGKELVDMFPKIGDKPGKSLWRHLKNIRKKNKNKMIELEKLIQLVHQKRDHAETFKKIYSSNESLHAYHRGVQHAFEKIINEFKLQILLYEDDRYI